MNPAVPALSPTPQVFVLGAGVVGSLFALRLQRAGVPVLGIHGRSRTVAVAELAARAGVPHTEGSWPRAMQEAEVVIVARSDGHIEPLGRRLAAEGALRRHQTVLQTCGSVAAESILAPLRGQVAGLGTLHPLLALTLADEAEASWAGAYFGIQGDDAAQALAGILVHRLQGTALPLSAAALPLYHAGAVMASNHLMALVAIARSLLGAAGIASDLALAALLPLAGSAVRNLETLGLPDALTGPLARGDGLTIRRHLDALAGQPPAIAEMYRLCARTLLPLAHTEALADALAEIETMLSASYRL